MKRMKLMAIACVMVLALAGLAACGGGSNAAKSGSAAASASASVQKAPLEFKDLVILSNDELKDRLEADGYSKGSDGSYSKGSYQVALGDGSRVITYNGPDLAYTLIKEKGVSCSKLGEYFNKYDNVEFAVGVCQVGSGTGVVAGSGGTKDVILLVCEPGHMSKLSKINKYGSYTDSMSADDAAKAFAKGLNSNYFEHMDGDKF